MKHRVFIHCLLMIAFIITEAKAQKFNLLIGTYTKSGKSEGIYVYEFDVSTAQAYLKNKATGVQNPNFLAITKDNKFVYSINDSRVNTNGGINAYSFDKKSGSLKLLNQKSVNSVGPCHVTVDDKISHVFVTNYAGGSISVLPVLKDGSLAEVSQLIVHEGKSVHSRQDKPHTHSSYLSPDGKQLFVIDLGLDKILVYQYNRENTLKPLTLNQTASYHTKPGVGPRHFTFHPNKKFAYSIHELTGTVEAFTYNKGGIKSIQIISALPEGFTGTIGSADIHISPDGKFLYASNRGTSNDIAIFSVQKNGSLIFAGRQSTLGKEPRNFAIDPTGNYLLAANQSSDSVVIFKRDKNTGLLSDTGERIEVGSPVCLKFGEME